MLKRALTTSGDEENYSEFDLLDEQMVVSVQQLKMDDAKIKYSKPIRYESTAFLDQSQWKTWTDIVKYDDEFCLNSMELQLTGYSWPDPTRYAFEFILFTVDKEDFYSEKICEKKRFAIDGEIIKVGTTFYGRKYIGNDVEVHNTCLHLGCDARQLFKIDDCRIPFGLIIRLLKRRQFIGEPDFKKQRIVTNKTLVVNEHRFPQNERRFPVNSHQLSICSPVFSAMFENDMKEKNEEEVEIKDVASSDHFAEFLRALSPNEQCLPNPSNVLAIYELADRFQISSLMSKCERILRNCFEIPFTERFFFADKHSLKGLIDHLLGTMDSTRLKRFYLANKEMLDARHDLVVSLLMRISVDMGSPKAERAPRPPRRRYGSDSFSD